ncbi:MAG: DUF6048 family protein [Paludibacteraceae bacterium]
MSKIFNYIIISSLFAFGLAFTASAQDNKVSEEKVDSVKEPLFQGFFVEVDVAPLIENNLINKYAYSYQGNLMINLRNRFFPLVEVGYGGGEQTNSTGIYFKSSGVFEKIGIDLRLLKPKPEATIKNNYLLGGVRIGMSHFNYTLNNAILTDPYWGETQTLNQNDLSVTKLWFEIVAGLRVSVHKNIYMGWNIRNKRLLSKVPEGQTTPWYIPGYGIGNSAIWGFSYIVGYRF